MSCVNCVRRYLLTRKVLYSNLLTFLKITLFNPSGALTTSGLFLFFNEHEGKTYTVHTSLIDAYLLQNEGNGHYVGPLCIVIQLADGRLPPSAWLGSLAIAYAENFWL